MSIKLPDERNPYSGRTPFEVLGVAVTASASEIRDAHEQQIEEINDAQLDEKTRLTKLGELKQAYNILRNPDSRASVEALLFTDADGREDCLALAKKHEEVNFDYSRILDRSETVFAMEPNPDGVEISVRKMDLDAGAASDLPDKAFEVDHRTHAINSILFER